MCGHYYLVELRPDEENYETWSDIESIDLGNALRLDEASHERGRALARVIAKDYAIAHPDVAQHIHITYGNCNGADDSERPYKDALPAMVMDENAIRLAKENVRLRAALSVYANKWAWKAKAVVGEDDGVVSVSMPISADGGDTARSALALIEEEVSA